MKTAKDFFNDMIGAAIKGQQTSLEHLQAQERLFDAYMLEAFQAGAKFQKQRDCAMLDKARMGEIDSDLRCVKAWIRQDEAANTLTEIPKE